MGFWGECALVRALAGFRFDEAGAGSGSGVSRDGKLEIEKAWEIPIPEWMASTAGTDACRNCGTELRGAYCHDCGQSAATIRRPARELLHDIFGNLLQWDSRLIHTLRLLFFSPGRLSGDWVEGRRARHVPPFRLYLVASLLLFLLVGLTMGPGESSIMTAEVKSESVIELQRALEEARANGEWLSGLFLQGTLDAVKDPAGFTRKVISNLPKAAFLLLPIFALLHMGINIRQGRFYIDYLVFSLNFHAFAFLLFALVLLLGLLPWGIGEFADILNLLVPVYLVIAFRNFNQQGVGKSLLKALIALGAYSLVLAVGVFVYFSAVLFF